MWRREYRQVDSDITVVQPQTLRKKHIRNNAQWATCCFYLGVLKTWSLSNRNINKFKITSNDIWVQKLTNQNHCACM
jgi:hypothetical protein